MTPAHLCRRFDSTVALLQHIGLLALRNSLRYKTISMGDNLR